jgi:hypothetical protein
MIRGVAEASKIVGVDKQQIKNWSYLFREYLSKNANQGQGKKRQYNEKDILILLYVSYYWEETPDMESIKIGLDSEDYYEDLFIQELYRHTPLLQNEIPEVDEPYRHGLLMSPTVYQEPLEVARSYRYAAEILWQKAMDSGEPGLECYPMLFTYRHTLELYLKILGCIEEYTHNLLKCMKILEKYHQIEIPVRLREWIETLHLMDSKSTTHRYAQSNTNFNMDDRWLDLNHFKYAMDTLFNALDFAVLKSGVLKD